MSWLGNFKRIWSHITFSALISNLVTGLPSFFVSEEKLEPKPLEVIFLEASAKLLI